MSWSYDVVGHRVSCKVEIFGLQLENAASLMRKFKERFMFLFCFES